MFDSKCDTLYCLIRSPIKSSVQQGNMTLWNSQNTLVKVHQLIYTSLGDSRSIYYYPSQRQVFFLVFY